MSWTQNRPYVCDEESCTRVLCACGESERKPYCDGSHSTKSTGKTPIFVELAEAKKVAWCGCGESKNKPFCDGTHRSLPPKA